MSISPGEVIHALKQIYDICEQVHDAQKDVEAVKTVTLRVKKELELLKQRMDDPKSHFYQSEKKIKSMLEDDMAAIIKGKDRVEAILNELIKIPRWEMGSYLVWVFYRIPQLKLITQEFESSRSSISYVIQFIQTDALDKQAQNAAEEKKNAAKAKAKEKKQAEDKDNGAEKKIDKLLRQMSEMRKSQEKAQAEREKAQAAKELAEAEKERKNAEKRAKEQEQKAEKLVKELNELRKGQEKAEADRKKYQAVFGTDPKMVINTALHGDSKKEKEWVTNMVKNGLSEKEAKKRVEGTLDTIRNERQRVASWPTEGPKPGAKQNNTPGTSNLVAKANQNSDMGKKVVEGAVEKKDVGKADATKNGVGKKVEEKKDAGIPGKKEVEKKDMVTKDVKQNDLGKKEVEKKDVATKEVKQKDLGKKPAERKDVKKNDTGNSSPKGPQIWILVVDETNGARSIITQTYLELVRSWTMNTTKQWLFARVDSAGRLIPKAYNPEGPLASEKAIKAIAGDESHFWSKDPDEKEIILDRMKKHKSCGLADYKFQKYHYMLCFDEASRVALEAMKSTVKEKEQDKAKVTSKVYYLRSCEWFKDSSTKQDDLLKLCGKLKFAIKEFLRVELDWERPLFGISQGEFRTLQIVSKDNKLEKDNNALAKKIVKLGCGVHWVPEQWSEGWLISISGPRNKLDAARKMILGSKA